MRTTLPRVAKYTETTLSRGIISEQENHLLPEAKEIHSYHSVTTSNKGAPLELYQPIGLASVLIKQQEEENQQQSGKQTTKQTTKDSGGTQPDWNHNQPKGPAAECVNLHIGSFAHQFALPFDRRVHPYDFKSGENPTFLYAADGSEQGVYMDSRFTRVMSLDGKSVADKKTDKTRYASLAHVTKPMQTHKKDSQQGGQQQQQEQEYKHEGETINTEIRCTKDRIEFRAGDTVYGYFEVSTKTWHFNGTKKTEDFSEKITAKAPEIAQAGDVILGAETKSAAKQLVRYVDADSEGNTHPKGSHAAKVWGV